MTLKTSSALLLMILLASCANPTESAIPTPLASPAPTATSAPSKTPTPKPTETPTLTPTPEVQPLTREQLQNFDYQTGFGTQAVSYDEMVRIANEPLDMTPEDLASRYAARVIIQPETSGDQGGHIDGRLGENIFPQFAVLADLNGIQYRVITSWVILQDNGGQNILKPTLLVFEDHNPAADARIERMIHVLGSSPNSLNILFSIKDTELEFDPNFYEPLVGESQARADLANGVINSDTVVLWIASILGN